MGFSWVFSAMWRVSCVTSAVCRIAGNTTSLFFSLNLMLKGTRHEVSGCPCMTGCERTHALISLLCMKGNSHMQKLSESGLKLLASLEIFRWHFQRKCSCAEHLGCLWTVLKMHLQTSGFISSVHQKMALFQLTLAVWYLVVIPA